MAFTTTTEPAPTASPRRQRRRGDAAPVVPLGSLTQRGAALAEGCASCGSGSVTTLSITLTDGTPARFASCRGCGHRQWADDGGALSIADVLARAAKP